MKRERVINKYVLLYMLLLCLPLLMGQAGSILFDSVVLLLYLGRKSNKYWKDTFFLITPIAIAFFIGLSRHFPVYDIFKDIFYLLTPILTLMLGEIWARKFSSRSLLQLFLKLGIVFSVINILVLLFQYGPQVFIDPRAIRDEVDSYYSVNSIALISFAIAFFAKVYGKTIPHTNLALFVNLIAFYLSGSRSFYLVVMIYSFIILLPLMRRNMKKFVVLTGICISLVIALIAFFPSSSIIELFLNSGEEMAIQEYTSMADVNKNYRGYEAFCALADYAALPTFNQIFGGGCGQLVDLGELSPFEFQYIPILHNGYPYFLIKMGVFGMIIFFLFFVRKFILLLSKFIHTQKKKELKGEYTLIAIASIIAILIMHFSVNAIFNFGYNSPLLFLAATLYYYRTNHWKSHGRISNHC
ncbi:MAG: O-antigen ligase family protein [Bacteroidaceae bacterium]|nr:O-antigen ligase family protein [Bacteroidaceae bacterium]